MPPGVRRLRRHESPVQDDDAPKQTAYDRSIRVVLKGSAMRRFVVEAVIDALIALVVILVLSFISVPQPFPFGQGTAPIFALRGAGLSRLPRLGGGPGPRQPVRPSGDRGAHRSAAPVDDGPVHRDRERDRDLGSTSLISPDQDRHRRRARPSCGSSWPPPCTRCSSRVLDAVLGLNRPRSAEESKRSVVADARVAADAAPQHDHREPAPPAGLRRDLLERARHRAREDADRPASGAWFERRVLGEDGHAVRTRPDRRASGRCSSSSGPTYVKIGQMVASRGDLLPPRSGSPSCRSSRARRRRSPGRTPAR